MLGRLFWMKVMKLAVYICLNTHPDKFDFVMHKAFEPLLNDKCELFDAFSGPAPGVWITGSANQLVFTKSLHSLACLSCDQEIDEFSYSAFINGPRLQSHLIG